MGGSIRCRLSTSTNMKYDTNGRSQVSLWDRYLELGHHGKLQLNRDRAKCDKDSGEYDAIGQCMSCSVLWETQTHTCRDISRDPKQIWAWRWHQLQRQTWRETWTSMSLQRIALCRGDDATVYASSSFSVRYVLKVNGLPSSPARLFCITLFPVNLSSSQCGSSVRVTFRGPDLVSPSLLTKSSKGRCCDGHDCYFVLWSSSLQSSDALEAMCPVSSASEYFLIDQAQASCWKKRNPSPFGMRLESSDVVGHARFSGNWCSRNLLQKHRHVCCLSVSDDWCRSISHVMKGKVGGSKFMMLLIKSLSYDRVFCQTEESPCATVLDSHIRTRHRQFSERQSIFASYHHRLSGPFLQVTPRPASGLDSHTVQRRSRIIHISNELHVERSLSREIRTWTFLDIDGPRPRDCVSSSRGHPSRGIARVRPLFLCPVLVERDEKHGSSVRFRRRTEAFTSRTAGEENVTTAMTRVPKWIRNTTFFYWNIAPLKNQKPKFLSRGVVRNNVLRWSWWMEEFHLYRFISSQWLVLFKKYVKYIDHFSKFGKQKPSTLNEQMDQILWGNFFCIPHHTDILICRRHPREYWVENWKTYK